MERRKPLRRTGFLKRGKPLQQRSAKTEVKYIERRALVEAAIAAHPLCELCGANPSSSVHERLFRSRGGDILDPVQSGQITLCWKCHRRAHDDKEFADRWGLAWHSWDAGLAPEGD